jgi:single-stranded-DNA-specific exonuclease
MKKWEIQNNLKVKSEKLKVDDLLNLLLANRGLKTKKEIEEFLNPVLESLTSENLGINENELVKSIKRINKSIKNQEQIIVFGDYDVDGITGTAIFWESLNSIGANIMPYIPHRTEEGYGLSLKGIDNVKSKYPATKLIVTVDNGIVANEAVDYANSLGLEVIITDHHVPGEKLPNAFSIVHSTKICGAGVGWFLAQRIKNNELRIMKNDEHLGLVALATVTDVMPLTGFNRTLLKFGLEEIKKSKRPGLIELFKLAGIDQKKIGVYELGHVIGPRLNAMGRIEHAMDSLRFLCTNNLPRAKELATKLHLTNKDRQQLTFDSVLHAKNLLGNKKMNKLIIIADKSYEPGVIGLISGRLTEEHYRPSIVISESKEFCKGSARSVPGFNIIEFIRQFSDLLVDVGGHPMAAGFTVETKNLVKLKKSMKELAEKEISEDLLIRKLKIDCELPIEYIDIELFEEMNKLAPFGFGNPEPTFLGQNLLIENIRLVGVEGKHLKLELIHSSSVGSSRGMNQEVSMSGILFGYDKGLNLKISDSIDAVYNILLNEWNGNRKLELKIKDIK